MSNLIRKFLFLWATVRYPKIKKDYRYLIRDNYYCRLVQLKFLFKDYIRKQRYRVIEFNGEFQQELTFVLPFAYWRHRNGTLKKTISCKGTKALYFFSEDHDEKHIIRVWQNNAATFLIPNMTQYKL